MKPPKIITAALFAVSACLAACAPYTDPVAIAKQQKAAKIGNKLLDFGVRHGIVSKTDADTFREIGEIVLEAPPAIPAPPSTPAEQPPAEAKNPPKVPVYPVTYRRSPFLPARPQYCANTPRGPPMARAFLS